ncbi:MAG TPA: LysE family transporter [Verrucomicrobiae bacterium]|jgi:threonine/homoserine/homoserine lactone efflux protein
MTGSFLLKGLVIGFSIAAPVGPIGVLCIRRSLAEGALKGFVSGLGAATADAMYGCIAGFSLTAVANFLVGQKLWLGLLGGAFLCYLGVRTFVAKPATETAAEKGRGHSAAFFSTLALTLTNPATILSFIAVFAGFGLGVSSSNYADASLLVLGVFVGSACWWLLLSGGVGLLRSRVDDGWMRWVNRLSGAVLFAFGGLALAQSLSR